jgi:hypothetical protein
MLNVLLKANSCVFPVVLHMDSTFKLNDNEFPLVVIGITDGAQQLHVLNVSIVSHHMHGMYMKVLQVLKALVPFGSSTSSTAYFPFRDIPMLMVLHE